MNDDVIADLKQFISSTISQQTSDLRADIAGLSEGITQLDARVDSLSSAVAESLDNTNEATDALLKDHAFRITKLEQKTA